MSKNGESLASVAFSSDISGIPSCNIDAMVSGNIDEEDFNNSNMKNVYVKLDIMGKLQIQGTLSDVRKFTDHINEADDNDDDEKTFKSYVNQANSLANFNLFYDGKSAKQAIVTAMRLKRKDCNTRYGDGKIIFQRLVEYLDFTGNLFLCYLRSYFLDRDMGSHQSHTHNRTHQNHQ